MILLASFISLQRLRISSINFLHSSSISAYLKNKSSQMNEEISLASQMQLDSDKKWEALSESLDSLGEQIDI